MEGGPGAKAPRLTVVVGVEWKSDRLADIPPARRVRLLGSPRDGCALRTEDGHGLVTEREPTKKRGGLVRQSIRPALFGVAVMLRWLNGGWDLGPQQCEPIRMESAGSGSGPEAQRRQSDGHAREYPFMGKARMGS